MVAAVLAALAAAACFGVANALQHRSAGLVGTGCQRPQNLFHFIVKSFRHPVWVMGSLAGLLGSAFHIVALRNGPLTVVQPLLVSSVIFALPLRHLLERRSPRPSELAWAVALAAGLGLFFAVAVPGSSADQAPDTIPSIVATILVGSAIVVFCALGRRADGDRSARLWAIAAALAFAASAGLLKEVVDLWNGGIAAVATTWPVYALVLVAAAGLVLSQLAFRAGPLTSSLPVLTTVDPVVSLIIGVAVFDEPFRNGPLALLGEFLALALVVLAAVQLTRSGPRPGPPAPLTVQHTAPPTQFAAQVR